jgi:hypothetical protein
LKFVVLIFDLNVYEQTLQIFVKWRILEFFFGVTGINTACFIWKLLFELREDSNDVENSNHIIIENEVNLFIDVALQILFGIYVHLS